MIAYRNKDFIYEAISKLEQLLNISIEIISKEQNYDALIKIRGEQFVLETKSAIRNSNQGLVLSQLEELQQQSRWPIIVIADFISKDTTKILKERNINYIDTSGNAYINHNDLAIFIEGQKTIKKERTNQSRAFQESGLKILFYLLINPEHIHHPYRKIAEKVDVSLGSVSQVMAELEDLNYLLKTEGKRTLKNRKKLLEHWMVEFNAVLRPRIIRKRMRFLDKNYQNTWRNIHLHSKQGTILWGGEPGAAILTGNLKPEQFTIFTDLELSTVAKELQMVPSADGEVEILQKFWSNDDEDKTVAPPLLIYADLINSGFSRNVEIANQILKNELQYIK
jgi:hypothetical protein